MKKIILLILMLIVSISLFGCENDGNKNEAPIEQTHTKSLSVNNYDTFLNVSYTVSFNGPVYGSLGYNYYFTVTISSMNPKYTFSNVEIVFDKNSSTKFKLASTGNSTYTLTYYQSTNNVAPTVKIKSITGNVTWIS